MWGGTAKFDAFGQHRPASARSSSPTAPSTTRWPRLVVDGVFYRFPELRVVSIENGSDWVALLVKRLKKQANQTPWDFEEDPLDTMRRNLWVTPYYEEDLTRARRADRRRDASCSAPTGPTARASPEPTDFVKELHAFDAADIRRIMRDNALDLLGTTP